MSYKNPADKKAWNDRNKDKLITYRETYKTVSPERRMLNRTRARALRLGIPFDLTLEALGVIPDVCPVLGIPLVTGLSKKADNSPSLDKIIPELGYVTGNVQIMSEKANRMKADATLAELRLFAKWVDSLDSDS